MHNEWEENAVRAVAEALTAEDAKNWGYDHGFEATGDAETDAFARVAVQAALPLIKEHIRTLITIERLLDDELNGSE